MSDLTLTNLLNNPVQSNATGVGGPVAASQPAASNAQVASVPTLESAIATGEKAYTPLSLSFQAEENKFYEQVRQMSEESRQNASAIGNILRNYAPHAFEALRKILAYHGGQNTGNAEAVLNDAEPVLERTVQSDPSGRRLRNATRNMGNIAPELAQDYLTTLQDMLTTETTASTRMQQTVHPVTPEITFDENTGVYATNASARSLSVEMEFDLFFSLTDEISATAGQEGASAFFSATRSVTAEYQANFHLSIEAVGGFFRDVDALQSVSPETAQKFNEAMGNLNNFDEESLEEFNAAADELFNELEAVFGENGGMFDNLAGEVKAQAKLFQESVGAAMNDVFPEMDATQIFSAPAPFMMDSSTNENPFADMIEQMIAELESRDDESVQGLLEALSGVRNYTAQSNSDTDKLDQAAELLKAA